MVQALKTIPPNEEPSPKRITLSASSAEGLSLDNFVTRNRLELFQKLRISVDFLDYDPEMWTDRDDYNEGIDVIHKLQITNDHAERGVALVQELNQHITYDEYQFQFLLQVIADHRRQYSYLKSGLNK